MALKYVVLIIYFCSHCERNLPAHEYAFKSTAEFEKIKVFGWQCGLWSQRQDQFEGQALCVVV
jgi:hypothetical protein